MLLINHNPFFKEKVTITPTHLPSPPKKKNIIKIMIIILKNKQKIYYDHHTNHT